MTLEVSEAHRGTEACGFGVGTGGTISVFPVWGPPPVQLMGRRHLCCVEPSPHTCGPSVSSAAPRWGPTGTPSDAIRHEAPGTAELQELAVCGAAQASAGGRRPWFTVWLLPRASSSSSGTGNLGSLCSSGQGVCRRSEALVTWACPGASAKRPQNPCAWRSASGHSRALVSPTGGTHRGRTQQAPEPAGGNPCGNAPPPAACHSCSLTCPERSGLQYKEGTHHPHERCSCSERHR